MRSLYFPGFALLCLGVLPLLASGQPADTAPAAPAASDFRKVSLDRKSELPETLEPTWDTRPNASTMYFQIPAPRGQITDRNGLPLAQSKLAYHLDLNFPPGDEMSDTQLVAYVKTQLVAAQGVLKRPIEVKTSDIVDHYRNRRMLPMDLVTYLSTEEVAAVRANLTADSGLSLRPVYLRFLSERHARRAPRRLLREDRRDAAGGRSSPTRCCGPTWKGATGWRNRSTNNSRATRVR